MSVDPAGDIRTAERREAEARARLTASLQLIQAQLKPKALAERVQLRLTDAAAKGADAARRNPLPVIGAGLAAGMFLARHRIARLFRREPARAAPRRSRSHSPSPSSSRDNRP